MLDLAILAEFLDGGDGTHVVTVVNGIVVSLGVADDGGIGDLELAEQELIPEEHIDALGAVSVELGLSGILGTVVHKAAGGGEEDVLELGSGMATQLCE